MRIYGTYMYISEQLLKKLCAMGQNVGGSMNTVSKNSPQGGDLAPAAPPPSGAEENMSSESENEDETLEERSPDSDTDGKEGGQGRGTERTGSAKSK